MPPSRAPILLVDHGDLPSLAAALIQPDPSRLILWHRETRTDGGRRRRDTVDAHRQIFGARDLTVDRVVVAGGEHDDDDPVLGPALELMLAAIAARRLRCDRLVWPVQEGLDPARVEAAVERATLVSELAAIDDASVGTPDDGRAAGRELVIELPLVDLDDAQVIDLADDGGAPPEAFWPCETDRPEPCGACPSCLRWGKAYGWLGRPEPVRTPS